MRQAIPVLLSTALLLASSQAAAFDGERRGFLLGLAGGLHLTDGDESGDGFEDFSSSTGGLSLRVTLGGGISERFTLYAIRDTNIAADDAAYGLTGAGSTFYFNGAGPGAFLHGALGVGDITFDEVGDNDRDRDRDRYDDYDYDSAYGVAAMFGGGYAFTQGFHVDGSVMLVDVTDDDNFEADVDYTFFSARVMAGYTWF